MPHEVVTKILMVAVSIAIVGIASAVLLYLLGVGAVKADIIVERFELREGSGTLTIRNVSNIKVLRVDRLELICSSKNIRLDPSIIPIPMPPGSTNTIVFEDSNINAGDSCKLFIEAEAEGGYKIAVSSAEVPVRSI
jgi:hypothetical protein